MADFVLLKQRISQLEGAERQAEQLRIQCDQLEHLLAHAESEKRMLLDDLQGQTHAMRLDLKLALVLATEGTLILDYFSRGCGRTIRRASKALR